MTVEQVPVRLWEHMTDEDRRNVSALAEFVAARLQYPMPPCNGRGVVSTIAVAQWKLKFGQARIYCTLASPELVADEWGKASEPSEEHVRRCWRRDAEHYRRTYLDAVALCPRYRTILCGAADYPWLLATSREELDAELAHWGKLIHAPREDIERVYAATGWT